MAKASLFGLSPSVTGATDSTASTEPPAPDGTEEEALPTPAPNVVAASIPPEALAPSAEVARTESNESVDMGFEASTDSTAASRAAGAPSEAAGTTDGDLATSSALEPALDAREPAPEATRMRDAPDAARPASKEGQTAIAQPTPSRARRRVGWALGVSAVCALVVLGISLALFRVDSNRFFRTRAVYPVRRAPSGQARTGHVFPAKRDPARSALEPRPEASSAEVEAAAAATTLPSAAPTAVAPAPGAQQTEGSDENAPGAAPGSEGKVSVTLQARPEGSQIYSNGKFVGRAPVVIELEPGEKRALEVSKPGYGPRRVVLDGRRTEVLIGLRRQPNP